MDGVCTTASATPGLIMDEAADNQSATPNPARQRVKVLLADDSPEFLIAASEALKGDPRLETVGVVLNGDEAIRMARQTEPDLVFVDHTMPEKDGIETTAELKKLAKPPRVVVITGEDDAVIHSRANEAGADALIPKSDFIDGVGGIIDTMFYRGTTGNRGTLSANLGERIRNLNHDATVVLIDDDFVTQELVSFLLTNAGYRIHKAGNGRSGLDMVHKYRPELVLLDIGLPDISGIEVCREIKKDPELKHTLVMHLSATHTSESDMERGLKGGADAYFTLPFQQDQLLSRVDSLVRIARLESALRANARFHEDLFDNSNFGVAYAAPDGRLQAINDPLQELFDRENWQISGRRLGDLASEKDRAAIEKSISRMEVGEHHVHRGECRFDRAGAEALWVRLTVFPQRDGSGKVGHLIVLFEDITPQKKASAMQETMLESIPASIALLDSSGRIVATNKTWDDHFTGRQLMNRSLFSGGNFLDYCTAVGSTVTRGRRKLVAGVQDVLAGRLPTFEADYSHGEGRDQKWFQITAKRMDGEHADGALVMHMDITEKTNLEHQLRQSQKMDALGQLAGGVAHDFSNLLIVVRCNADILARPGFNPGVHGRCIRDIQSAAERASKLTRQLLAFSRQQPMELSEIDLGQSVHNLMSMLKRLLGEGVKIECDAQNSLPATLGDSAMIDQVLINLAVNARDAMPDGGTVTVRIVTVQAESPVGQDTRDTNSWVKVSVSDTGSGIPAEIQDQIFDPFFTTKQTGKGTGLGLATVHGIVSQHEGWIELESEPGEGAEFRFFLPAVPDEQCLGIREDEAVELRGGERGVLVVEDDTDVLTGIVVTLEQAGFKVWQAADRCEAEKVWRENQAAISMAIVDIVLPNAECGEELVEHFQIDTPDLSVLLISGYRSKPARLESAEHVEFIQKPFSMRELTETLAKHFDER